MAVRLAAGLPLILGLLPVASAASSRSGIPVGGLGLILMGVGGILLFLLSVIAARKARKPKPRPPPKRSFERGVDAGRLARVGSESAALRALAEAPVGKLVSVTPVPHGYRVTMSRRRSEPCEVAAGYVVGLFETAWARDVILVHDACGGRARGAVCTYEVRDPRPRPSVSPAGAPAAGASTPRSGDAPRRWPPARPGGV